MALRDEALESTDGNGHIQLPAAAGRFAGMSANAATDGSERIGDAGVAVCFLVPSLRNEGDVSPGLRVNGTGLHAGEVRFEPLNID